MTQNLAKFHGRSPRYILQAEEDCLLRLAGPRQDPWEEDTEIQNISLTGLAFTAPSDLSPQLGEIIKIQFTPPKGKSIASYSIVTRIEKSSLSKNLIAIHFYKMDMGHRVQLAQSLSQKLKNKKEEEKISSSDFFQKGPTFLWATFLIALWSQIFFLLLHYRIEGLLKIFFSGNHF